ncbi:hypothetical protein M0813_24370 [Anaeramoeba flamelloides]|uniref:Uncharacterized protein n=1 Tax=Anaeramoeba flamelloides TaxID=1746091 RepID=A0ABQ8Y7H5_9EUKA|nr:hypothetical protein M0813_24370 [Anaeramoeba flamelloides]
MQHSSPVVPVLRAHCCVVIPFDEVKNYQLYLKKLQSLGNIEYLWPLTSLQYYHFSIFLCGSTETTKGQQQKQRTGRTEHHPRQQQMEGKQEAKIQTITV